MKIPAGKFKKDGNFKIVTRVVRLMLLPFDMKKRSVRLNRFTGEPRKWTCLNNSAIDAKLEDAEMWHYFAKLAKENGAAFTVDVMPTEILRRLVAQDRQKLEMLQKYLHAREPLTEAEKRYCEAEAIPLDDFIRRLPRL
ncbi:MAG TPA: hypothetical protein VKV04_05070 [Verrucomicrobiae bacterium]|nr:hypothetical protein [Verrucomicrobiae bacterium]